MQKKKSGTGFIIFVLVLIVAALIALFVLNQKQEEITEKSYPSYETVDVPREVKDFDLENQPMIGKEDAPVSVIKFGDFKCPACKQWEQTVYPELFNNYIETGKVKFYFINFQFLAPDSLLAGTAGEIIYKQRPEAFWEYYQAVYDYQQNESITWANHKNIVKLVTEKVSGIDLVKFEKDLEEFKYFDEVKYDYQIAQKMGVTGTPNIFINGVKSENQSFESIQALIEAELAKTTKIIPLEQTTTESEKVGE